MSVTIRRAKDRGHAAHGWLESWHTFSFADYYDPGHMAFRSLRVINEDFIAGGMGFGEHPHKDMEIITYVLEGTLAHRDSMGHQENIKAGDVQKMSAGAGVTHSEFNADPKKRVHLFQIWIMPDKRGIEPAYSQMTLPDFSGLRLIAGKKAKDVLPLQQDAQLFIGRFKAGETHTYTIKPNRGVWLQMTKGHLAANGQVLQGSDAAAIENESSLNLTMAKDSEFLLFDL